MSNQALSHGTGTQKRSLEKPLTSPEAPKGNLESATHKDSTNRGERQAFGAENTDTPLKRILSVLAAKGIKPKETTSADGWRFTCLCPAHDDSHPSLRVGENPDGSAKVKCFVGCSSEAILQKLGLKKHELFPPDQGEAEPPTYKDALHELAALRGWTVAALQALGTEASGRHVRFPMRNHKGGIVGWKRRRADGKLIILADGRETKSKTEDGGHSGLFYPDGIRDAPDPVLILEGEADTASVLSTKWEIVVGTGGAAPGPIGRQSLQRLLNGRQVVLFPDPDEAGATGSVKWAASSQMLHAP